MRRNGPKKIDKKVKKRVDGKCYFCGNNDYSVLDAHRIHEGQEYSDFNTLTLCANCHRKTHAGTIKILGKHFSTSGKYVVHFISENGEEMWL